MRVIDYLGHFSIHRILIMYAAIAVNSNLIIGKLKIDINSAPIVSTSSHAQLLPHVHIQRVKQSICPSVVVVVGTKITISCVVGVYECSKHNQLVDIRFVRTSNCSKGY